MCPVGWVECMGCAVVYVCNGIKVAGKNDVFLLCAGVVLELSAVLVDLAADQGILGHIDAQDVYGSAGRRRYAAVAQVAPEVLRGRHGGVCCGGA